MNSAVANGLAAAVDRLDDDPGLSVGIVTGAGGSFCAGMDLKAFARGELPIVEGRGMGFTERPPVKPLIAAVEGYALAGGTELALATDLIVASKDSAFGIPEVKRGLVAGGGGLLRLPQRIPAAIAMELALTGENGAGTRTYRPAVKREACVRAEGESFMQRIFGGAAKPLIIHFAQHGKLTADEVRELKKILDQSLHS